MPSRFLTEACIPEIPEHKNVSLRDYAELTGLRQSVGHLDILAVSTEPKSQYNYLTAFIQPLNLIEENYCYQGLDLLGQLQPEKL